ncbi:MAG: hypothetical protein M1838_002675 [Thelocarpon superellum]|nr:MAG: hypothetical protein M1838_002675 [Thelocarpon superellum]
MVMSNDAPVAYDGAMAQAAFQEKAGDERGSNLLVVSPYTNASHLFELNSVSPPNRLLAQALTVMRATRDDYAVGPYTDVFNWDEVVERVRALSEEEHFTWRTASFYVVVFRSRVPPWTDRTHLAALDIKSHEEAIESGGLLKYWFGVPDADGRNLATCVWRERNDARQGSKGDGHRRAVLATQGLYTEWKLERLRLTIHDDARAWDIAEWED